MFEIKEFLDELMQLGAVLETERQVAEIISQEAQIYVNAQNALCQIFQFDQPLTISVYLEISLFALTSLKIPKASGIFFLLNLQYAKFNPVTILSSLTLFSASL